MKWLGDSEIVAGLVLTDKIPADAVNPTDLHVPYDLVVEMKRDGLTDGEMLDRVSMSALHAARTAADTVPQGDIYQYVDNLKRSALFAEVGHLLEPEVKRLARGENADMGIFNSAINKLDNGNLGFETADKIAPTETVYVPSYYKPLDDYIGGLPVANLTMVCGLTGSGKSSFLMGMVDGMIWNNKHVAIFTLEMRSGEFMYRLFQIAPRLEGHKKLKYLHMIDSAYTIDDVYARATMLAAKEDLHMIGIDYADCLAGSREQSESVMGRIYTMVSNIAKRTGVPVVLLGQYRRTDRIPTIEDIRYSGRAEQASALILLLLNLDQTWNRTRMVDHKKNPLMYVEGVADIIVGKMRYVGKNKDVKTSIGSIRVKWESDSGRWGTKPLGWVDLRGAV